VVSELRRNLIFGKTLKVHSNLPLESIKGALYEVFFFKKVKSILLLKSVKIFIIFEN
jgi:hypothetical protein